MLSKAKIKYIRSLELKKNRKAEKVFVAEGPKLVGDLLGHFPCHLIAALPTWWERNRQVTASECIEASEDELARASFLKTPQEVIAVFEQPTYQMDPSLPERCLCLALDGVQDPGNLGTIIRLADWFGIEHIFCSPQTADVFNPKTVQATMGGLARVHLYYSELPALIRMQQAEVPIYGTLLDGENMYQKELENRGLLVMGNEGNGITPEVASLINRRLYIPNYPIGRETSESLNVAVATAIACAEFRRQASIR